MRFSFADNEDDKELNKSSFWEELPCGIYSISMGDSRMNGYLAGELRKHNWTDPNLEKLIQWDRSHVEPRDEKLYDSSEKDANKQHLSYSTDSISKCSDSSELGDVPYFSGLLDEKYELIEATIFFSLKVFNSLPEIYSSLLQDHWLKQFTCNHRRFSFL